MPHATSLNSSISYHWSIPTSLDVLVLLRKDGFSSNTRTHICRHPTDWICRIDVRRTFNATSFTSLSYHYCWGIPTSLDLLVLLVLLGVDGFTSAGTQKTGSARLTCGRLLINTTSFNSFTSLSYHCWSIPTCLDVLVLLGLDGFSNTLHLQALKRLGLPD